MKILDTRKFALAALVGSLSFAPAAFAADSAAEVQKKRLTAAEKAELKKRWQMTSDELEKSLGVGHDKAYYRQALEKLGYAITAKNYDEPDYLEYEIVKGDESYEVQVDLENGKSDKVDVTVNMWRADTTVAALRDKNYKYVYPATLSAAVTASPQGADREPENRAADARLQREQARFDLAGFGLEERLEPRHVVRVRFLDLAGGRTVGAAEALIGIRVVAADDETDGEHEEQSDDQKDVDESLLGHQAATFSGERRTPRRCSSGLATSVRIRNTSTPRMPSAMASGTWLSANTPRNFAIDPGIPDTGSGKASASWNEVTR